MEVMSERYNPAEPPRKWPHDKRLAAEFNYGIDSCANCGRIVPSGQFMFAVSGNRHICEKCWDRGVR